MAMKTSHSRHLRGGRQSEPMACYVITKCVGHRRKVLANDRTAAVLFDSLNFMRSQDRMRLLAFCVMPDHLHLLVLLLSKCTLQELIRDYSRFTARQLNRIIGSQGDFWEEGFHDSRCRDENDMVERLAYIEHNPVRAGLVARAEEWKYSSAHRDCCGMLDRDWYAERR